MRIGVPSGASLGAYTFPMPSAGALTSVVYYGGAFAEGAVTGRPGETFVNRVNRNSSFSMLNMGLADGCLMDLGTAAWLVQLLGKAKDIDILVVDCGWDMNTTDIQRAAIPFLQYVRAASETTAILLVGPTDFTTSWLRGDVYNVTGRRAELLAAFNTLVSGGMSGLFYVDGRDLVGESTTDLTFDGYSLMDEGHRLFANSLVETLTSIVATSYNGTHRTPSSSRSERHTGELLGSSKRNVDGVSAQRRPSLHTPPAGSEVMWVPAEELTIRGRAFNDTPTPFNRLPAAAKKAIRSDVWLLSLQSAGLFVAFSTACSNLYVKYSAVGSFEAMPHFSATGISGLDLYAWNGSSVSEGQYQFVTSVVLPLSGNVYEGPLVLSLPLTSNPTRYILYFPNYNTPASLSIGVSATCTLVPDDPFPTPRAPIVWYGTSILQGAAAVRPGNIATNIVSRGLNREVFNFGFSGNGKMEINVTAFLKDIPAPAAFIVDCDRNLDGPEIAVLAVPLVRYFRQWHPSTPIVLVEGTEFGRDWAVPTQAAEDAATNAALAQAYATLVSGGDAHLHYVHSSQLFDAQAFQDTPTAAALHPTDRGMQSVSGFWLSFLPSILVA